MRDCYYAYSDMGISDSTEYWGHKIIEQFPYDGEIVASLAAYYNAQGCPQKASGMTTPYIEQRKPFEAYDHLLKAAQIKDFKDFYSLYHLGKVAAQTTRPEATGYLNKAIQIVAPDSITMADIYNNMAEVYYGRDKYELAADAIEKSASYTPDRPIAYYNIAQMYHGIYYKTKDTSVLKKEMLNYKKFLSKSQFLEQTEENLALIEEVKRRVGGKYRMKRVENIYGSPLVNNGLPYNLFICLSYRRGRSVRSA